MKSTEKTLEQIKDEYAQSLGDENFEDYLWKIADSEDGVQMLHETFDEVTNLYLKNKLDALFEQIKHGDESHQDWLKEKMNSFYLSQSKETTP